MERFRNRSAAVCHCRLRWKSLSARYSQEDFNMADLKARPRPTGATAVLGRTGFPHVTSATKGEIDIVTAPSQPGFNPLDLLYSSLSACLVLSARIAASQMGILDKISEITAEVTGEKATEGLSRVAKFNIAFSIKGDIDEE